MQNHSISYEITGAFSNLFLDYINQKSKLLEFSGLFPTLESFQEKINQRKYPNELRQKLVSALENQYRNSGQSLPPSLSRLNHEHCYTITTGHQLCLLGGPLFVAYKILATIKYAQELKTRFPENDFVPVFWMASEDHDFEEINHIHLFNKKAVWDKHSKGPVGRLDVKDLDLFLKEIFSILGDSENALLMREKISHAYLNAPNLASATRIFIHLLFPETDLLIIDGDDPLLKKEFSPILKNDLKTNFSFQTVSETNKNLEVLGYKVQVNPREVNLFYLGENSRERIVKNTSAYEVLNTSLSFQEGDFLSLLESSPEKFSPNVVTRPLYQEFILPNIGTVLGPGELSYWLEFKNMFDKHAIPFPLLLARPSFLLLDENDNKKINKLNISLEDLFLEENEIIKKHIKLDEKMDISLQKDLIFSQLETIKQKGLTFDKSLESYFNAEITRMQSSLDNLEKKLIQINKKKNETQIQQLSSLKNKLFPAGHLQERENSYLEMLLKFGTSLNSEILQHINLFDDQFKILISN